MRQGKPARQPDDSTQGSNPQARPVARRHRPAPAARPCRAGETAAAVIREPWRALSEARAAAHLAEATRRAYLVRLEERQARIMTAQVVRLWFASICAARPLR